MMQFNEIWITCEITYWERDNTSCSGLTKAFLLFEMTFTEQRFTLEM
jgi:hypothetical protein